MISRRYRIQEKRLTRRAVSLFILSGLLLILLIFFGIPTLAQFAALIGDLRQSGTPIVLEDKTPPAPPYLNQLPAYTQEEKAKINGVAEAGATLKIFQNGEALREFVVDQTSSFSFEVSLSPGKNLVEVSATDSSGNESERTGLEITFDREPPLLEVTSPADGETVSTANIELVGKTESGARVTVNGRIPIVDSQGNFSQPVQLNGGENTIVVKATDAADNLTEKTIKVTLAE